MVAPARIARRESIRWGQRSPWDLVIITTIMESASVPSVRPGASVARRDYRVGIAQVRFCLLFSCDLFSHSHLISCQGLALPEGMGLGVGPQRISAKALARMRPLEPTTAGAKRGNTDRSMPTIREAVRIARLAVTGGGGRLTISAPGSAVAVRRGRRRVGMRRRSDRGRT